MGCRVVGGVCVWGGRGGGGGGGGEREREREVACVQSVECEKRVNECEKRVNEERGSKRVNEGQRVS